MLRIFEPQFVSDFTDGLACAQYIFFGDVDQPELDMFLCGFTCFLLYQVA